MRGNLLSFQQDVSQIMSASHRFDCPLHTHFLLSNSGNKTIYVMPYNQKCNVPPSTGDSVRAAVHR
jgi:hypothetical protein